MLTKEDEEEETELRFYFKGGDNIGEDLGNYNPLLPKDNLKKIKSF